MTAERRKQIARGMALSSSALASPALAMDGAWYVDLPDAGETSIPDIEIDPLDTVGRLTVGYGMLTEDKMDRELARRSRAGGRLGRGRG